MYYGSISRVQTSLIDIKFSFSESWRSDNHISANQPPFPSQSPNFSTANRQKKSKVSLKFDSFLFFIIKKSDLT